MGFKEWIRLNESASMVMTAYHCGCDFDKFSIGHHGKGEGTQILGPGIYFVTDENIAKMYCKYSEKSTSTLYEVEIDTTNFYCVGNSWNRDKQQSKIVSDRVVEIGKEHGCEDIYSLKYVSPLKMGHVPIGSVVSLLGNKAALDAFVSHNVQGALENLPAGVVEMAVFDPSVIKLISKTVVHKDEFPKY